MADDPKSAPQENPELLLGPGGVPTPTGDGPGPTPTPQEPPTALKPVGELLGKKDGAAEPKEEPKVEPKPAPAGDGAAGRISQLTAEKWSEKRAREAAEARAKLAEDTLAELARLDPEVAKRIGAPEAPPVADGRPPARTYTQAEVQAEARRLAAEGDFNRRVNDAVLSGRAAHTDFDAAIGAMKELTPVIPGDLVAAALETGAPGDVLYALGKDRVEYDRILSMSPIAQAIAISQLAGKLKAEKDLATQVEKAKRQGEGNDLDAVGAAGAPRVSRAPEPIKPAIRAGGRSNGELPIDDPNLPLAEFIKRRNEQEAAAHRH